jgi:hypothetical protein
VELKQQLLELSQFSSQHLQQRQQLLESVTRKF